MPADPAETPQMVTVAEGFHVRQAVDNIAWIDLGDCGLVVDALEQPELEEEVFAAIRGTLGDKPVRYVLNTHTHYDHTALNQAFQRRFGAEIINRQTSRIPAEGRLFQGSRRRVLILPMPGCHTADDCIIRVPDDKALFVGDIFGWGLIPLSASLSSQTAKLLIDAYSQLIDFGAAVVIPGHGPLCTTNELRRWVRYFRELRQQVAHDCSEGKSNAQIMEDIAPPEDMKTWWRFTLWKHEDSLTKVLDATRAGRLG